MEADGLLGLEALVKLVALEHLRDGEVRGEADRAARSRACRATRSCSGPRCFFVEDLEDLLLVGFGVGVDLLAGERLAGDVAAGGVADEGREVADEEDDGWPSC